MTVPEIVLNYGIKVKFSEKFSIESGINISEIVQVPVFIMAIRRLVNSHRRHVTVEITNCVNIHSQLDSTVSLWRTLNILQKRRFPTVFFRVFPPSVSFHQGSMFSLSIYNQRCLSHQLISSSINPLNEWATGNISCMWQFMTYYSHNFSDSGVILCCMHSKPRITLIKLVSIRHITFFNFKMWPTKAQLLHIDNL